MDKPVKTLERLEIVVGAADAAPATPETPPDVAVRHSHVLHIVQCANHGTPISGGVCTLSGLCCPVMEYDLVIEE